jgi:hypothetical protein
MQEAGASFSHLQPCHIAVALARLLGIFLDGILLRDNSQTCQYTRAPAVRGAVWYLALFAFFLLFYTTFTSVTYKLSMMPAVVLGIALLAAVNPTWSADQVLLFLRIGGGIPVDILTKTMKPGGKDVMAGKSRVPDSQCRNSCGSATGGQPKRCQLS